MTETKSGRAHLIAGGFPPGSYAGHDHDYARLRLLGLLAEQDVPTSVANDFDDVEKWLPVAQLLITYVAGPYPGAVQCRAIQRWVEAGGHWLGLHGTSGGRAERVEGMRQRRTVKTEHHALLGSYFLTHPPICKIRVEVRDPDHPLTRGVGSSFEVEDEPYFIELQDAGSTRILLSADYGPSAVSPAIGTLYASDTSLQPDGRTRVLGYTREIGKGGVTYVALGHCHNPAIRAARTVDPTDATPPTFRVWCCATPSPGAQATDRGAGGLYLLGVHDRPSSGRAKRIVTSSVNASRGWRGSSTGSRSAGPGCRSYRKRSPTPRVPPPTACSADRPPRA